MGGAEKLLLYYLKTLDKNKYSLYVCCLRDKPDDLAKEISKYAQLINLKIKNKFNPIAIFYLLKVLRQITPHIVHTHLFQPRIYTSIANLFYRKSVIITQKHSIVNPKKHNLFILFEMICIRLNRKIIAISESVKNSLIKYEFVPEHKIYVLPNCLDFKAFNESSQYESKMDRDDIILGTVGRLEIVKGLDYLLMAIPGILKNFPKAGLEIIGDGSQIDNLKELSIKLKISNSVNFFGKFTNVIPFYNKMDIFILPSILEGFGIVLLEAMAAGVPVIATNVDGIREVVVDGESGILIPPKDPDAIAKAVSQLINDPKLRNRLVENGFRRAQQFDVQEHVMKLENLYSNLLGVESYK